MEIEIDLDKNEVAILTILLTITGIIIIWTETNIIGALIWIATIITAVSITKILQKTGRIPSTQQIRTMMKNRRNRIRNPKIQKLTQQEYQSRKQKRWNPKW